MAQDHIRIVLHIPLILLLIFKTFSHDGPGQFANCAQTSDFCEMACALDLARKTLQAGQLAILHSVESRPKLRITFQQSKLSLSNWNTWARSQNLLWSVGHRCRDGTTSTSIVTGWMGFSWQLRKGDIIFWAVGNE